MVAFWSGHCLTSASALACCAMATASAAAANRFGFQIRFRAFLIGVQPPAPIPVIQDKKGHGWLGFFVVGCTSMTADITGLLEGWGQGDEAALGLLMSAMYPEL